MRLEGSLDAFSLPDIFSLLSMTKKTGGLHLRRSESHGVVWLGDGLITGGASDLSRLSLGRRLAGSGHVADNHLTASVDEVAKNGDLGIARALRDHNSIDEDDLHTLVSEHIVDTVFDLMRWPDGVFEFVVDEANIDDVGVTREVEETVTEARRRIEVWSAIDSRVANLATVLCLALDLAVETQLQPDEWEMLALIDGRRTVGDVVNLFGRGEYAVVVSLAELAGRGLIRPDDNEGVAVMLRRQELIASLETGVTVTGTAVLSAPAAEPATQESAAAPTVGTAEVDAEAADAAPDSSDEASEPVAHTTAAPESEPEAATDADADSVDDDAGPAADADNDAEDNTVEDNTVEDSEAEDTEAEDTEVVAEVSDLASFGAARDLSAATQGSDPEPLAALAAAGGGAASALPAGAIERDPSVNKSLLLRLIAGVRGL